MTIYRARVSTLYFLVLMNVVILICGLALVGYVAHLRGDVNGTQANQREICERGNVIRGAVLYLLAKDGSAQARTLAKQTMLQIVPCRTLYP